MAQEEETKQDEICFLIAFFAVCYSVMFSTLPPTSEAPKLSTWIKPGQIIFPDSISIRHVNQFGEQNDIDFMESFDGNVNNAASFLTREPTSSPALNIRQNTLDSFGNCSDLRSGSGLSTYAQLQPCVFAKLNRVFDFPDRNISINLILDFPSEDRFESEMEMTFEDFKANHITVRPSSIDNYVPFRNTDDYEDVVAAIQLDFSSMVQDIQDGTKVVDFRLGVQFDWGQSQESFGNGFETFDISIRED
eukprot:gene6633-340_t